MLLVWYLLAGICSGLLAGMFGVGGGMIIVPVLVYCFISFNGVDAGVAMHVALGTSLAIIVFTSINAVIAHQRKGAVEWGVLRGMTVGIALGAMLGAATASWLSGITLQVIAGLFSLTMAAQLIRQALKGSRQSHSDTSVVEYPLPSRRWQYSSGMVIGWASALFGIGGGSLTVPLLTSKKLSMHRAVATSSACGLSVALFGAAGNVLFGWGKPGLPAWSLGYVNIPALCGVAIASMLSAHLGVKIAHRASGVQLKLGFALLMVCVGVNFIYNAWQG